MNNVPNSIISTSFSWAKFSHFFTMQNAKSHLFKLTTSIKGTCFQQMLNIFVNFGYGIMKKLLDLAHEIMVNIQAGHGIGFNFHGEKPNIEMAIYVLKSACGELLCTRLYFMSTLCMTNHKVPS